MNERFFETVKDNVKYWWGSLISGILALILSFWCLATPDATLVTLAYLFICAFLVNGIMEIIFALSNRKILAGWGWNLASGIIDLLFGLFLVILPLPTITVMFIYFVGFWIMFRSIWTIGQAVELQRTRVKGWGWLLTLAILSVIFSFIFLISPIFSGAFIVLFVSFAFLVYGIFRIYLAFRLRSMYKEIKQMEKNSKE